MTDTGALTMPRSHGTSTFTNVGADLFAEAPPSSKKGCGVVVFGRTSTWWDSSVFWRTEMGTGRMIKGTGELDHRLLLSARRAVPAAGANAPEGIDSCTAGIRLASSSKDWRVLETTGTVRVRA
jgi:hypothetical protein